MYRCKRWRLRALRLGVQEETEDIVVDIVRLSGGQELEGLREVEGSILIGLQKSANLDEYTSIGGRLGGDSLRLMRNGAESEALWERKASKRLDWLAFVFVREHLLKVASRA